MAKTTLQCFPRPIDKEEIGGLCVEMVKNCKYLTKMLL